MSYFDIVTGGKMIGIVEYDQDDNQIGQPTYFPAGNVSVRYMDVTDSIQFLDALEVLADIPLTGIRLNGNPDDYSGIATNIGVSQTSGSILNVYDPFQSAYVEITGSSLSSRTPMDVLLYAQDSEDPSNILQLQSEVGLLKTIVQRIDNAVSIKKPIPGEPVVFDTRSIGTTATLFLNDVPERTGITIQNGTDQIAYFKWEDNLILTSGASRSYHFTVAAGVSIDLFDIDTTQKLYVKFASAPNANGIMKVEYI